MKDHRYLRIAVPSPLRSLFDYLPPPGYAGPLAPGMRVRVPFGKRETVGVLVALSADSHVPADRLKPAIEVLDGEPALDAATLQLYLWAAEYYQFPPGQVLQTSLPKAVRAGKPLLAPRPRARKGQAAPEEDAADLDGTLYGEDLPLTLNPDQGAAVDAVGATLGRFAPHLLEGVTGSGKTEVYLQLIARVLERGGQVLVLVPEIGLTPQTIDRFRRRFRRRILCLHSNLSDGDRFRAWLQARGGEADIIIGTRSAIFTPLARPGLIIVDEEHDQSYKQHEGFRYSARDLAVYRARLHGVPVLMGSATPSLESLQNALDGRYALHPLRQRAGSASTPRFLFIDLRGEPLDEGFSRSLLDQIGAHLSQGRQALVFLNRRGFAPLLQCHDCGWVATCARCETSYTLHRQPPGLRCHHCDSQRALPDHCPDCAASALLGVGMGTERTEAALRRHFPDTEILRVDRDSTRGRDAMDTILERVATEQPCILVGTQMLAKGHHFPAVTLVAVLDADSGLFSPDFRGQEWMGQLLTQVAGRAGRGDRPGEVLVQTHHIGHPALNRLVKEGYASFARGLLEERHGIGLPPFSSMALVRAEATRRELPERFLAQAAGFARAKGAGCSVLGPMPSPLEKRAGKFRFQLWLQAPRRAPLHHLVARLIAHLEGQELQRKVRWSVDIDPLDFS